LFVNLNKRYVASVELLAACQGIELRRPLKSNTTLEGFWSDVRRVAVYWDHDRYFQPDLGATAGDILRRTQDELEIAINMLETSGEEAMLHFGD